MIRRIVPGILVFGLIAGLSGTLAGHLWKSYSQQTFELGFGVVYERYFARFARIADDALGHGAARATSVQQASAFEE